jgi:predicted DNA-binding ribbon-helix-helix protein
LIGTGRSEEPVVNDKPSSALFAGPAKHSITIAGHRTSISLEPILWEALHRAAGEDGKAVNTLVAEIDELRIAMLSSPDPTARHSVPNLASAIRSWLWQRYCK